MAAIFALMHHFVTFCDILKKPFSHQKISSCDNKYALQYETSSSAEKLLLLSNFPKQNSFYTVNAFQLSIIMQQ